MEQEEQINFCRIITPIVNSSLNFTDVADMIKALKEAIPSERRMVVEVSTPILDGIHRLGSEDRSFALLSLFPQSSALRSVSVLRLL